MRQYFAVMAVLCLFLNVRCADIESDPQSVPTEPAAPSSDSEKPRVEKGEEKPAPPKEEAITPENLSEHVQMQVQPTTKPEKYMVYFAWPKLQNAKRIRIRMEQNLALVEPTQTTFSHEVSHDQTLTYTFDILDEVSKVEKSFSKQVKIPRDLVIRDGTSELRESQKITVKRLFINSDTPLRTNGFDVEIIVDELISDRGFIETFPTGSTAAPNFSGRSGGELFIKAKSAIGTLSIYMRGQHGGNGSPGEPYSSRAPDGRPPGQGYVECSCRNCPIMSPAQAILFSDIHLMYCTCMENGSDGTNGASGAKGRAGKPAGNGGSSGNLRVEITDGSAFYLQTDKRFGLAGTPGAGGPGQPGGLGQGTKTRCSGNPGGNGANGPQGDPGPSGQIGKLGNICIYIATEGKNDCF